MELKDGVIRLSEAAVWLSQKTGRHFTIDDLLDAADQLPICALIPRSLAHPKYSGPVQRAFQGKLIEVERATDVAALGGTLTDDEIAEKAVKLLPEAVRLRLEWEKEAFAEGVYALTAKDVRLLVLHGEHRLSRAVPASDNIFEEGFPSWIRSRGFHPWIQKPIEFGKPLDVTADRLCVLRSHLVKYCESVAAQQADAIAPIHEPPREQESAEPKADEAQQSIQAHRGAVTSASKRKRVDSVQVEIDDLIAGMGIQGESVTAAKVMARLRERAGKRDSCISECAADGVIWLRGTTGKPEKLTMAALQKRIGRTAIGR